MAVANEPGRLEDETAYKLILAGMDLFGQYGFKGTTTRMIAEAAGSNIGSIAYYFDNKTGLYLAIARHIARRMREVFGFQGDQSTPDTLDRGQALAQLEIIVRRMVHQFAEAPEARRWLMLVIREQANPTAAFDILYEETFERVHIHLTRLIAVVMDRSPDERRVIIEAHTVMGQIVFFLVARFPLLRRLGLEGEFPPEVVETAEQVVISHLHALAPR
ncbi:CerR family C-terminal domain-containing protein [Marinobacter sp. 71-i]|uniref:CerR family C-terminal domain-containing protein n=1 Tax=Marinobacter iranensis TaxID=2962607 RepID=A0ABT5Y748_9GAMM|nr:CerR family C-terminal domain-containing protein [Marinobacter iranensis]MDF0749503.1 CerR family C-terminal domain-containing protein [Marinobacter iranensis]